MIAFISKVQTEVARGNITYPTKPVSVEGCTYEFSAVNITNTLHNDDPEEPERDFLHISFMYYTLLGSTIVVVSSVVYSLIFGFSDPSDVDLRLLAPFIRKYFVIEGDQKEQEMIKCVNGKNPQKIEYNEDE